METPILVDEVAWEQGALVRPAGGDLYFCTTRWEHGAIWDEACPGGMRVPIGSRGSKSVDL